MLQQALAQSPGRTAAEIVERALADRLARTGDGALNDSLWERLKNLPGLRLPAHWPPRFKPVRPLEVDGELPSQRLVRERR